MFDLELRMIAQSAQPGDSLQKIASKLEEATGHPVQRQLVWRRIRLMRDDLAESGDRVIYFERASTHEATAGRVARIWAKYRL